MFRLSTQQKKDFDRDGFLIVERLIDDDTVERLRDSFEALFRGEFETGVCPDEVNWQEGTGDPSLTRQICNGWKANIAIASVITRPDIGEAIASLGNWPGTRVMSDNVLWKPPQSRPLGFVTICWIPVMWPGCTYPHSPVQARMTANWIYTGPNLESLSRAGFTENCRRRTTLVS